MAGYQQLHARPSATLPALQRERTNLPSGAGQKIMTLILIKDNEMIKLILTSTLHSVDGNSGDSTSVGGKTSPGQPTLQGGVHDDHDYDL